MRIALVLCCVALVPLGGCAVVPSDAWTFDPTQPAPKAALPAQQVVPLTERVAQLQLERNSVRARIAQERDIWARQGMYRELHGIGMELSPLERELGAVAGR